MSLALSALAIGAKARDTASRVAVLPLVVDTAATDDYTVLPKASELAVLATEVRAGLSTLGTLAIIPVERHESESCTEAGCARRIARAFGASSVVFGTVSRAAATGWTARVSAVRVSDGRTIDTQSYPARGDYAALLDGAKALGRCLGRAIAGRTHCTASAPSP